MTFGKNTLLPYLLNRRIKNIDYLVFSHFDTDHCGGLLTIMSELKVKKVVICEQGKNSENYEKFKNIVSEKKIEVVKVKKGDKLNIEKNINFQILWPKKKLITENILNNNSVVAKLNYKDFSILFTGDIEEIAEKQILEEYKNNSVLKSDILKVGHHGSKTSTTEGFLEKIKPKIALIGIGENNKFGHPNDEVIERLNRLRAKIYRTDENGEIELTVDDKGRIKIRKFI